jgi:lipid-A-disaccharide synthase-like uncharacterized protein
METIHLTIRFYLLLIALPERDERGDVPGWVLITVMTAGLVTLIYALAKDQLTALLTEALSGITG